jgi:hypothetical protein
MASFSAAAAHSAAPAGAGMKDLHAIGHEIEDREA